MDITRPGIGDIEAVRRIHAAQPGVRVLMVTMLEELPLRCAPKDTSWTTFGRSPPGGAMFAKLARSAYGQLARALGIQSFGLLGQQ